MQSGHEHRAFIAGMAIAVAVSAGFALNAVPQSTLSYGSGESHSSVLSARSALAAQDKAVTYSRTPSGATRAPITEALQGEEKANRVYDAAYRYLMTRCAADQDSSKTSDLIDIVNDYRDNKTRDLKYRQSDLSLLPVSEQGQMVVSADGSQLGVIPIDGCSARSQLALFGDQSTRRQAHASVANLQELDKLVSLALNLDSAVGKVKDSWAKCMSTHHDINVIGAEAPLTSEGNQVEAFDTASHDCRNRVGYDKVLQTRRNAVESAIAADYPGVITAHERLSDVSTANAQSVMDSAEASTKPT